MVGSDGCFFIDFPAKGGAVFSGIRALGAPPYSGLMTDNRIYQS
jgi:hypothetical protein